MSASVEHVLSGIKSTPLSAAGRNEARSRFREDAKSNSSSSVQWNTRGLRPRLSQAAIAVVSLTLLPASFIFADMTIHTPDALVYAVGFLLWAAGSGGAFLLFRRWF
jgi:hypothetical protein